MKKIKLFIVFFFLIVFSVLSQNPNKKYETYTAIKGETLQSIARKFSITPFNLIQLNPELVEGVNLNGKIIIVPNKNYKPDTVASKNGEDYVENGFLIHTVLVRENYFRFKKKYGVSKRILRKHNPILRIENLKVGQVIKIPVKDDFKLTGDTEQNTKTKPYIVKPREAKYGISKRYGISIEQLEKLNPQTKGRDLKMAELILVPDSEEIPEAEKGFMIHKVVKGETLQSIARKFSITPFNLIQLNPKLVEGGNLNGKILIVPNKNYNPNSVASKNGEDYVENGFLIHTVLVRENYFRFKKKYGVSKRILIKNNPILRIENLKAGQVIKIPVKDDFKLEGDTEQITETKPYIVKPREAKYGISKRYGISIEQLEELNPQTKGRDFKMAELILVPDSEEIPEAEEGFTIHKVVKGETFFSLGKLYAISQDDLILVNPELTDGVKEGILIKIPIVKESSKLVFIPSIDPDKKIKVALMLPFMANRKNIDFEKYRTSDIATDFYLGAMMALDSVKKLGLSVNLKVFDTQNNKTVITRYIIENDFSDTDVIIGPLFTENVELISKALKNKNVAIVSPVSKKDHSVFGSNKIVQDNPSHEKLMNKVLNHVKTNYKGENIVIFSDTTKAVIPLLVKSLAVLEPLDSLTKIEIIKPIKGYFKPELFRQKILKEKDNILILITDDPVVTKDVVQNLGVLPKDINATFFAMDKGSNFNDVNNNYLAHVNFHYPVSSFIDTEDENVKKFVQSYKYKNKAEPSDYSFKGFDVTYDALLRFASYDDIASALKAGYSNRIATKYEYDSNGYGKGFINQGIYLLKYDGLNIVKVEENPKEEMKQ